MDLNYNIDLLNFPLTSLCAITVVHQVLKAGGNRSHPRGPKLFISGNSFPRRDIISKKKDAMDRISKLNLPLRIREKIECFVRPIVIEQNHWYYRFRHLRIGYHPVWTMYGTVDIARSTVAVLKNEKTRMLLEYRMKDQLQKDYVEYSEMHRYILPHSLTFCELFSFSTSEEDLKCRFEDQWVKGIQKANPSPIPVLFVLQLNNYKTFQIFLCKGSATECSKMYDSYRACYRFRDSQLASIVVEIQPSDYSPMIHCLLFSNMSRDEQQEKRSEYASKVLCSLLKWPYQQFFLESVQSLIAHLTIDGYWFIMIVIVGSVMLGYKDWDYLELFIRGWDLGAKHRRSSSISKCDYHWLVYCVLKTKDKRCIDLVFSEMNVELKSLLLLNMKETDICESLMQKKEFGLLETFIRSCAMNSRDLLVKFKEAFKKKHLPEPDSSLSSESEYEDCITPNWKVGLFKFDSIVDQIIAETYCK